MRPLFDIDRLQDQHQDNCLILTPNQRLASKIGQAWNQRACSLGQQVWQPLPVMALSAWIDDCWLRLQDRAYGPALTGARLTSVQERLIWQQVIDQDSELAEAMVARNFVELARQGWHLLQHWQLTPGQLEQWDHQGARCLLRWGRAFDRTLAERQLVSPAQATVILAAAFGDGALPRLQRITKVGFQNLTPLHETLIGVASEECRILRNPGRQGQCSVFCADTSATEIQAAANWAHAVIEENPHARVGIVIGDLAQRRASVERVFRNRLTPAWTIPDKNYLPPPFNLSAGCPLADQPLVDAALALLSLTSRTVSLEQMLNLLGNRYWGEAGNEGALRSKARWLALEQGQLELAISDCAELIARAEALYPDRDQQLACRLQRFAGQQRQRRRRQDFCAWGDLFLQQLRDLGWPGQRSLDSLEYQQHQHFLKLLDEFGALDTVTGPATVDSALQQLQRMARDAVFQAETPDSPIQILGTLEAAGLQFSHLWLAGMEDDNWPLSVQPHPLLPVPLQQRLGMPRASASRELELCRQLFDLFCHSADRVICSYSRTDGDRNLRPSRLVREFPVVVPGEVQEHHPWAESIAAASELELIEDDRGPPVCRPENGSETVAIRGGSRLLEDQATCPFNAFATWRLEALPLPEPVLGPDPIQRGILVHSMLEIFWADLPDRDALLHLSEQQLQRRISGAVSTSLGSCSNFSYGPRLRALEQRRLETLLRGWLDLERQREPFRILAREKPVQLELAGLRLSLRIDRVDLLDDGRTVLLDYKTGNIGLAGLGPDRVTRPQLALYGLARKQFTDTGLGAVVYGQVSGKGIAMQGLSDTENLFPGVKHLSARQLPETWEETLTLWNNLLSLIGNEYLSGIAVPVFYDRTSASRQTYLEPLNRLPGCDELRILIATTDLLRRPEASDSGELANSESPTSVNSTAENPATEKESRDQAG